MAVHRDSFAFIVELSTGRSFTFEVEGWDIDERPLGDEAVLGMALDLVGSGVVLYGDLSDRFPYCPTPKVCTVIDPAEVVGVFLVMP